MADRLLVFHPFRLDPDNQRLWRGGRPIALRPKTFAVLAHLVARPGRLVTKQELLDAVWPDTAVTDGVLKGCIREIREALGDEPAAPRYVETAHRRGYRFVAAVAAGDPAAAAPVELPGREGEIEALERLTGDALGGERRVAFVTGEPGIGKTALVEALLARVDRSATWIARGQCIEQYGAVEPYLPVLDALGSLCRGAERDLLVGLLHRFAPTWLLQMPSLVAPATREALQREALGATSERMLREMAGAVEAFAVERPLVLVLEDLHWADYSTLDLVSYLARRREPARLLVLGTYRPAEVLARHHPLRAVARELAARGLCREVELPFLDAAAIAEYLAARLGEEVPARLVRFVHERTEGNPLFVVHLVDYLVERGALGDPERTAPLVPEGVRQVIDAQVDALGEADQRLLEAAAVAGAEFSAATIAAVLGEPLDAVEAAGERLARRRQFLEPAGVAELPDATLTARYRFVHAIHRDALGGRVAPARRIQLHRRIAERLEAELGSRAGDVAAELAMHYEEGRAYGDAIRFLLVALENARRRFASRETAALARRGIALLDHLPAGADRDRHEVALRTAHGHALMATEGYGAPDALETFSRARALCGRIGDDEQLGAVLSGLWGFHLIRAELDVARKLAAQMLELAERSGDAVALAHACWATGVTAVNRGELARADEHLCAGAPGLGPDDRLAYLAAFGHDAEVVCMAFGAWALWLLGHADRALATAREAVELARSLAHPQSEAFALFFAAFVDQLRGDVAAARAHAGETVAVAREHGLPQWLAFGTILGGWAVAVGGEAEAGVEQIREGLAAYRATGAEVSVPHFRALLAEALGAAGCRQEALDEIDAALRDVERTGERYYEAELHRQRGELALAGGAAPASRDEAERCFRRAVAVAAAQGAPAFELRARESLRRLRGEE